MAFYEFESFVSILVSVVYLLVLSFGLWCVTVVRLPCPAGSAGGAHSLSLRERCSGYVDSNDELQYIHEQYFSRSRISEIVSSGGV